MLLHDGPLTSQPQEAVEVDEAHPSARGLITWNVGTPSIGGGGTFRPTGPQSVQAIRGLSGIAGFDDASVVEFTGAPRINGGPFTALVGVIYNGKARPYAFISQGGAGSGYGWKIGMYPDGIDRRFALTYGSIADYAPTSGEIPVDVPSIIGLTVSGDAGTGRYYIDGKLDSSFAVGTMTTPASRDTTLGAAHANSSYVDYLGTGNAIWLALLWNRELSADEVAAISANPWQLFRVRQVVLPTAAPTTDVAGSLTARAVAAASLTVRKPIQGSATGRGSIAGTLTAPKTLSGTGTARATVAGALTVAKPVQGSATGRGVLTGTLTVAKPLSGTCTARATVAGALTVAKPLTGGLIARGVCAGVLVSAPTSLSGLLTGRAYAAGTLTIAKPLGGVTTGRSLVTGQLTVPKPLAGAVQGSATVGGVCTVRKPLQGAGIGRGRVLGALTIDQRLLGLVRGRATIAGAFHTPPSLQGAAVIRGRVQGALTAPSSAWSGEVLLDVTVKTRYSPVSRVVTRFVPSLKL